MAGLTFSSAPVSYHLTAFLGFRCAYEKLGKTTQLLRFLKRTRQATRTSDPRNAYPPGRP